MATIKTHEIYWHNFIPGSGTTEEIVSAADYCLKVANILKEGEESKVLAITGSDSSPSLTMWDVLDEEKYKELCKKHGVDPEELVMEWEDDNSKQ